MQFSSFSREVEGLTIKFFNLIPVENVGKIKFYKDNKTGIFSKKEFRWSFNNEYWSSWQPLTQSSLTSISTYSNYYFFLEVRYVLSAVNSGNVTTFMFDYELGTATPVTPRSLTEDIQHQDASAVLIHDIIQEYKVTTVADTSLLDGHSGAYYLDRSHHTGKQPISTITGLQTILNNILTGTNYIKESSLGSGFFWKDGLLHPIIMDVLDGGSNWQSDGDVFDASINSDANMIEGEIW